VRVTVLIGNGGGTQGDGWKLDPAGIYATLDRADAEETGLAADLFGDPPVDRQGEFVSDLGWAPDHTYPVANAVAALMDRLSVRVGTVFTDIDAATLGVATALGYYQQGDETMASISQAAAAGAAEAGDLSWFVNNGIAS
jgi:hypothetical protein